MPKMPLPPTLDPKNEALKAKRLAAQADRPKPVSRIKRLLRHEREAYGLEAASATQSVRHSAARCSGDIGLYLLSKKGSCGEE